MFLRIRRHFALAGVAQWIELSACELKGCRFDSQSEHMPGLWARFPVGPERQPINVSLAHGCFFPLSSSHSLSQKNKIFKKIFLRNL